MKEANLQSLAISPPEELKMILEGTARVNITSKFRNSQLSSIYIDVSIFFCLRRPIFETRQHSKNDRLTEAVGKRGADE